MSSLCQSCLGANCLQQPVQGAALYSIQDNPIFYAPDFSIYPPCPVGFRCNRIPPPVIVGRRTLPPIIPQNGRIRIDCCQTPLFATIPSGSTASQVNAIIANLFAACAAQQAICDTINDPNDPPTLNPPGPPSRGQNPQHVCNTQQCATAQCLDPTKSITRCVDAGVFCVDVSDGSAASLNEAQGIVDGQAHQDAQARAEHDANAGGCNYCNDVQSGNYICPGDATKVSFVTIPACTYTSNNADDVDMMNAQARADLINALTANQISLGCACPGVTISPPHSAGGVVNIPVSSTCCMTFAWNRNSPLTINMGNPPCPGFGATFDPAAQFLMFNGFALHGNSTLFTADGPAIVQWFA
jgi:hypothetical protein